MCVHACYLGDVMLKASAYICNTSFWLFICKCIYDCYACICVNKHFVIYMYIGYVISQWVDMFHRDDIEQKAM